MKLFTIKNIAMLASFVLLATACFKDLDTKPLNQSVVTSAFVFDDPDSYKAALAKLYSGLALSGQEGPAGKPDISGIDEGFSTYLRQYWKAQELPTDEAVIGWNDGTIKDFHELDWDANNEFVTAMYNRIFYQITLVNEFLRQTTDAKLDERGVSGDLRTEIAAYRNEARFLRALSYWHALDMFRNVPFVTEANEVGAFFPRQASAQEIFTFVESELKAIEGQLPAPRTNEYARADQAAAWTLLAKMYLNAEAHIGAAKYTDCITYCKKVMDAGYTLEPQYANLFTADNHKAAGVIFPVAFDGVRSKTYGGMTFVVHAAVGGKMKPVDFGLDAGWGGTRATSAFVDKFPATGGSVVVSPSNGNTDSYTKLYVPGAYQGWSPDNANVYKLSSVNNDGKFEGYLYFKDDNTEFKITVNPNWSVNYGDDGANGSLEANGANLKSGAAGLYHFEVDLNALTYTLNRTDWGIIGDATPGGWGSDTNMSFNEAEGAMELTIDLVGGKDIKFRANDDWGLNYGDDGSNAILERNGANIKIAETGRYLIRLYLDRPDYTYSIERTSFDARAMFFTDGQSKSIDDISQFTNGYAVAKFKNVTSAGVPGKDPTFVDTDCPLFRIEDVHLMFAEAVLRGGSGATKAEALEAVNVVRRRAYQGPAGNIDEAALTLDFILDERSRELYWEGHRRTDLVRFNRLTTDTYLWPWKGGIKDGRGVNDKYNVFPIPSSDIGANPNLKQNTGY